MKHDGYQCGYCTCGQIMSAVSALGEIERGVPSHVTAELGRVEFSDAEVRERLSGNLCRCAAYPNIVAAVRDVHAQSQGQTPQGQTPQGQPQGKAVPATPGGQP